MRLKRFNVERVETDPLKIKQLFVEGYTAIPEPVVVTINYTQFKKAELVEMAEQEGIEKAKSYTKAELIKLLEK